MSTYLGGSVEVMSVVPGVLDPDAAAMVRLVVGSGQPPLCERGVAGARDYIRERAAAGSPGPYVDRVEDVTIPTEGSAVPVRLYRPAADSPMPVVVYFHGGGWVVGSVAASDAFCRRLADVAACVVVSVDYRLAPEHKYPAAVHDAKAAVRWTIDNAEHWGGSRDDVVVMGDSAGGNLATVAARRLLHDGITVKRQILAYPGVAGDAPFSPEYHGAAWPLSENDRRWFLEQYLPPGASPTGDPDIGPLHGDVAGLPPTTLVLGGCDPLLPEGIAYAERLIAAGVSVDLHVYSGQIHGFLTIDEALIPRSREALGVVVNAIRSGTNL